MTVAHLRAAETETDPHRAAVIETLTDFLEMAREGKLRSVACVGIGWDDETMITPTQWALTPGDSLKVMEHLLLNDLSVQGRHG